jgi:D-amino-acid dehydrogenase
MHGLRAATGIEYRSGPSGNLRILRDERAFERAQQSTLRWSTLGIRVETLSAAQTGELEPSLKPILSSIAGSIRCFDDETGDAYSFSLRLADYLRGRGVEFQFGSEVLAFKRDARRLTEVVTSNGRVAADHFVVACASYSARLVRPIGIRLPIRPVKGYSLTFTSLATSSLPTMPIVDDDYHAVVVPLGDKIRVAGTAEFAGFDLALRPDRIRSLEERLKGVLPQLQVEQGSGSSWCGLRAVSVDGVPLVGSTAIDNLFVNTGHGHLGWTMAAGSAELLADLMCAKRPAIDPTPYSVARFAR